MHAFTLIARIEMYITLKIDKKKKKTAKILNNMSILTLEKYIKKL